MPDGDNLSRSMPRAWCGAYRAAQRGSVYLAKYLAATAVTEIPKSKALHLLEPLAGQLSGISNKSSEQKLQCVLEMPKGTQRCRDSEIALHAAERVLAELVLSEKIYSTEEIRSMVFEEFCVEIPRAYCLGVLQVKTIPQTYRDSLDASEQLEQTEELLRQHLQKTSRELLADPSGSTLTKITKPRQKRPTQIELVGTSLPVNLDALGSDKDET